MKFYLNPNLLFVAVQLKRKIC